MSDIDYDKIPKHLRHLSEWRLRCLFYIFRGKL